MKLLIGIITYNSAKTIDRCLKSIEACATDLDSEIVVYDNSSTDNTIELVKEKHPDAQIIAASENRGYAFGVNRIAEYAEWKYMLIINPDVYLHENAIKTVIHFADDILDIGLIGAKLIDANGKPAHSHGEFPTPDSFVFDFSGFRRFLKSGKSSSFQAVRRATKPFDTGFVTGAFMLIPNDAWKLTGPMDEKFFLYFEDTDLAYRMQKAGKKVMIHPGANAEHESGASFDDSEDTMKYKLKCYFESAYYYFEKHYGSDTVTSVFSRIVKIAESKIKVLNAVGKIGANALSRQNMILSIHEEIKDKVLSQS